MVEDRVTSGTRVAQLLASELTGLETGPLADVSVIDADPDVTPTPDGARAYAIAYRDAQVGTVSVYPDRVRVRLTGVTPDADREFPVPVEAAGDDLDLWVDDGVAVKRAVDAIRSLLRAGGE